MSEIRSQAPSQPSLPLGERSDHASGVNGGGAELPHDPYADVSPANLAFLEDLYFQFSRDPGSVDPEWRSSFDDMGAAPVEPPVAFSRSIFAAPRRTGSPGVELRSPTVSPSREAPSAGSSGVNARSNGNGSSNGGGAGEAVAALVAAAAPLIRKTSSV